MKRKTSSVLCLAAALVSAESHYQLRGTSTRRVSNSELDLVIYTGAVGASYESMAMDWCEAMRKHVTGPMSLETKLVVLGDKLNKNSVCDDWLVALEDDDNEKDEKKRLLRIKTLKMTKLPYSAKVYFWLDVDVRPVAARSNWFRQQLISIVQSQATDHPFLQANTIALTRTRRLKKYNGGLFMYSDRRCVEKWRNLLLANTTYSENNTFPTNGRDQPMLLRVANSDDCDVLLLPEETQAYFTNERKLYALLLAATDSNFNPAFDHALIHLTGSSHSNSLWFSYMRFLKIY